LNLLKEVQQINRTQRERFMKKIRDTLWVLRDKRIAVWGLAFKPDTDDVRSSVAIELVNDLSNDGAIVTAYDPQGIDKVRELNLCKGATLVDSALEAVKDAEALVLATEWKEFERVDLEQVRKLMHTPIVFDGRNLFDPVTMEELGFRYHGIGRGRPA
jgi:UDPglucose 6-dehydrogenase